MATLTRLPIVSLVGRPNVGKSTFFNRIIGGQRAVVHDEPGVTRDRHEAEARWRNIPFTLIDTGGLIPDAKTGMTASIRHQTMEALREADLLLFLVDGREGVTALDRDIAAAIRASGQPCLVVVNKVETGESRQAAHEFTAFGLGDLFSVSSSHGTGIGDLLDAIVERLPAGRKKAAGELVSLALVGRPNVGKSSLVNRLLGEERMIVHDEPGTTRDAIDSEFTFDGTRFRLVDTAGLRKRSRIDDGVEYFSSVRTQRTLERCDVAAVVIDSSDTIGHQDAHIASLAHEAGKGVILLFNKWDLIEKSTKTADEQSKEARRRLPHIDYAPILYVSALTGLRVSKIPALARQLSRERRREITTSELNKALELITGRLQPPGNKRVGKPPRVYYGTQTGKEPPTFTLFVNEPKSFAVSYRRYLVNSLREHFEFTGTPIRVFYKARR